jgi:hypothetical protein
MTLRRRLVRATAAALFGLTLTAAIVNAGVTHSYTSTLSLTSPSHMGAARLYSGTQIHIQLTMSSSVNGTYQIALYKQECALGICWQTGVGGPGNCPYNGVCHLFWTGTWNGNYHFYFTKPNDGKNISSNNVQMWSWQP